jgi:hypothetical protein
MLAYEAKAARLVGTHVHGVTYWDIHNYSDEPQTWDYGDWHHAVMGLELGTDRGPVTVTTTNTFFPYGVEALDTPIAEHLVLGPQGPESWAVEEHPLWLARRDSAVRDTAIYWEHLNLGPMRRANGAVVEEAREVYVPVALRLDFDQGPVWFVAGNPQWPNVDEVFPLGDEILVVFTPERMRKIGFPSGPFTDTG